jgi:hypothetical protein
MPPTEFNLSVVETKQLQAIYSRQGAGLSVQELRRTSVPLEELRTAPRVFQYRDYHQRKHEKAHHLKSLVRAIRVGDGHLDPIEVFPVAGYRIVLDGHCRLAAYKRAGFATSTSIPIEHFAGDFSDALLRAAEANSKDKLPLTLREKLEAAWNLVKYDPKGEVYSLRRIQKATGASKSTAGNMRTLLLDDSLDFDPSQLSWRGVKYRRQSGKKWGEEAQEARAEAWAKRLSSAFGHKPVRAPRIFFSALEHCYPSLFPDNIPVDWVLSSPALEEANEWEDFDF